MLYRNVQGLLGQAKTSKLPAASEERSGKGFGVMGCKMSLKFYLLDAQKDKFKNNIGAYSERQDQQFQQDRKKIKESYQDHYKENVMGDYILGLVQELQPGLEMKREIKRK